jgi:hypothetical protein
MAGGLDSVVALTWKRGTKINPATIRMVNNLKYLKTLYLLSFYMGCAFKALILCSILLFSPLSTTEIPIDRIWVLREVRGLILFFRQSRLSLTPALRGYSPSK